MSNTASVELDLRRRLTPLLHVVSGDLIASYITSIIVGVRPGGRGARGPRVSPGPGMTCTCVGQSVKLQ